MRKAERKVDAVGIYWLDQDRWVRYGSELSESFGRLARGEMSVQELPAYRFSPPWDKALAAYHPLMEHWDWRDTGSPPGGTWSGCARRRGDDRVHPSSSSTSAATAA